VAGDVGDARTDQQDRDNRDHHGDPGRVAGLGELLLGKKAAAPMLGPMLATDWPSSDSRPTAPRCSPMARPLPGDGGRFQAWLSVAGGVAKHRFVRDNFFDHPNEPW
jgi:hypothetical protein